MIGVKFSNGLRVVQRAIELAGFWRTRPTFYKDLANSQEQRELFRDFIKGELEIATAEKTMDKNRARGLSYIQNVTIASDFTLHEVLLKTMPKSDGLTLSTLSRTKNIPASLREIASNLDRQNELTKIVRSALVTPVLLMPIGYAFSYVLASFSIPEFAKDAPPEVWNWYNSLVRDSAYLLRDYGHWTTLLIVLLLVWIFTLGLPTLTASWRYKMESARGWRRAIWILVFPFQPIFSLYRDIHGTRMIGNLANLMQSGMLLRDAINTLATSAQPWMRKHLQTINAHLEVESGDYVGAFSHGVLPKYLLSRMGSLVRRSGGSQFDKVLIELGTTGFTEAQAAVKRTATALNAALLVLTVSLVAYFYLGQQTIAYSIQDANSPSKVMQRLQKKQQP